MKNTTFSPTFPPSSACVSWLPTFAPVGISRDCSSVKTLAPCGDSPFLIASESAGELDGGAHNVLVGIRTRLQVNIDASDNLAVRLPRENVVKTFPIRRSGTVEYTRCASLGDGEERVDEGKLAVPRKPQKRGFIAVTDPGFPPIDPDYFSTTLFRSSALGVYARRSQIGAGDLSLC